MITREHNELLLKSINKFNIPVKYKKNIFWCPKVIDGADGVVLYIYGGHALDMRFTKKGLIAHVFKKDYCKYFNTEMRGEKIRNEFIEGNRHHKGLALLEGWSEERWEEVCKAFKACSEKPIKPDYERMRETRICNDNMFNNEISIFAMEEMIPIDNKKPEMDMVALREEKGKMIVSYIEYKCTESATKNGTSIPEHYADMAKILPVHENTKKMLQLYYQKQVMLGNDIMCINELECRSEIMFLISNIQWQGKVKKNQRVSAKTVYDKLRETAEREDFRSENVKVILLEDIDVESDEKYVLQIEKVMTVKAAMEKIQEKLEKVCD